MNVLVCIKQVPDMESKFKVSTDGKWFDKTDLAYNKDKDTPIAEVADVFVCADLN
jgi:electron transfer flavoprotein alpha/beta subunit